MTPDTSPLRVGIVCDYREEGWPSMDLVADMLLKSLRAEHEEALHALELRPRMLRRFESAGPLGSNRYARNADRLVNRFVDYPRWLKGQGQSAAIFHIVDHSYAHLVHSLPPGRTVVTCHDLDTFRSVLTPEAERRSWPFRSMTRRILSGLQSAARVTCDSVATRDGILAHGLLPPEKLDVVHLGIDPILGPTPDPASDQAVCAFLGAPRESHFDLLHVGSTIARKRIDVLLRTFAAVRAQIPGARLIRIGGPFTEAQEGMRRDLGIDPAAIVEHPYLNQTLLAAVYRRAAVVLQPSDAEGFGLPVAEAMASGVPVVASDLPVLREVGGSGAEYCPVGDIACWSGTVCAMAREQRDEPAAWERRRQAALENGRRFSWSRFAGRMVDAYQTVALNAHGRAPR